METFEARDVHHAVEMAESFKKEGRYDWFRGQTQPWPPRSSAHRKAKTGEEFKELQRIFYSFEDWVKVTPGLEMLAKNDDAIMAVAQHYGIATHFIDFSTDPAVAGFFAVDGATPEEELSCIYCLNTESFLSEWAMLSSAYETSGTGLGSVECIRIDVTNLWRLEAQYGVFLFANCDWDNAFAMDRIVFKNTGYPSYPTKADIYPSQKSHLEILLDSYFELQSRREGYANAMELVKSGVFAHITYRHPAEFFRPAHFVEGGPPVLASWNDDILKAWTDPTVQKYQEVKPVEMRLQVDMKLDPKTLIAQITYGIKRALDRDNDARRRSISWNFGADRLPAELDKAICWLWDGLRLLPVDNQDIAEGIAICVALHQAGLGRDKSTAERMDIFSGLLGPSIVVEFGTIGQGGVRALVTRNALKDAVRSDFMEYVKPESAGRLQSLDAILLACFNPKRLFEFRKLAGLFATQIAPLHVLTRDAATFSPARLETLGIP